MSKEDFYEAFLWIVWCNPSPHPASCSVLSSRKISLHTQPPASDFMCIYITYVILSSEPLAGRRRKDCTGAFFFFFLRKGKKKKSTTQALCVDSCVPGRGKKEECLQRGLPASALARHFGRGPGDTQPRGRPARATRAPCPSPGQTPPRIFREGEIDRAACLQRKRTRSHTTQARDTITLTLPPPSVNFR